MKYIFLILILISSLFSFEWPAEYDEALAQAKKEHKGVYVFVGTANCPFCTKLKETTFSDEELVKKLKKDYVNIYLSKDIDDIPKHLNIRFYPAHYFLDSDGKILYSTAGYRGKKCFLELLKEVKDL
ncbi:MAG: thioredoxin [Sulfurimonas sp.]|nr:MAG: thioredoxin [Sulfurimonas sp.]